MIDNDNECMHTWQYNIMCDIIQHYTAIYIYIHICTVIHAWTCTAVLGGELKRVRKDWIAAFIHKSDGYNFFPRLRGYASRIFSKPGRWLKSGIFQALWWTDSGPAIPMSSKESNTAVRFAVSSSSAAHQPLRRAPWRSRFFESPQCKQCCGSSTSPHAMAFVKISLEGFSAPAA